MTNSVNHWSKNSEEQLNTCHGDLIILFCEVLPVHDCSIIKGHRNKVEQNAAYKSGHSKLQWPHGNHNTDPSTAIDVKPYVAGLNIDGNNRNHIKYFYYFAGLVLEQARSLYKQGLIAHDIRWGGDWDSDNNMDDQTFNDLYHYELKI